MISLPRRSIASHTARFSSSLSVIAIPFQPRSAVARHSAPPNANDTGTDRLSATAAVLGFGDLNVDADRRPQMNRNAGGVVGSARVSGFSLSLAIARSANIQLSADLSLS